MSIETDNSCRICLQSSSQLESIFVKHEERSLSEIINELSSVIIEENDQLSKQICQICKSKALDCYAFRQLCIDSDDTVRYNLLLENREEFVTEIVADESLKIEESLEYFEEEQDGVEQLEYTQQEEQHLEYDELFVQVSDDEVSDGNSEGVIKTERKNQVLIERYDTKKSSANSSLNHLSTDELTLKMREAHFAKEDQKKHKCPHCDKFFMYPSKVQRHVNAVHKNVQEPKKSIMKNHHCHICNKAFVSMFKVRRHMIVHDTELKIGLQKNWSRNYFLCEACNKKFHTKSTFDRHMLICDLLQSSTIHRPEDHEYFCVICSASFVTHDEMVEHTKTHSPNENYTCIMCTDVSYSLQDMIRHGKYHEENVTYRCSVCSKTYPNGEEIVTHLLRHKEYKPFNCNVCDKTFFDKYKLKQHQNTHDPNVPKNFVCKFCDRAFATQDYMNCHIRRKHAEIKPYQCGFCPKTFAFLHDLNLHSSNHTGLKKHVCHICDASFTKGWSLKKHMVIHEEPSSLFQCNICDFVTSTKIRLQNHMATHEESDSPSGMEDPHFTFIESEDGEVSSNYNLVEIQTTF